MHQDWLSVNQIPQIDQPENHHFWCHVISMAANSNQQTVRQRIQYKVAVLTRKVRMTGASSYLSQHLVQHVATRQT